MQDINLKDQNLIMPDMKEIQFIDQFTEHFLRWVDTDPMKAKECIHKTIRPYMAAQLKTLALLEDQIEGFQEQNDLLLLANAEMIVRCKERGVPMPNFDLMQRDYYARKEEAARQAKAAGIIL